MAKETLHQDTDTVEAHFSSLARPCACYSGWVFVTFQDENGEEREAAYRCRQCSENWSS